MKAVLDHVGIAVQDLDKALAFYRDALGLEIAMSEDVVSQRVRAHFIPTGQTSLELLEATAADSAIAKYVAKRGPGIHHITLRVQDIHGALAQLRSRGVRLIDETPRPGAEDALIAFVHPSAAHGVLVELKQLGRHGVEQPVARCVVGNMRLTSLSDGSVRLDGGAMFGIVPRAVWETKMPPDDRGRIMLALRALLVEGHWGRLLVDCGVGNTLDPKWAEIFGLDRTRNLEDTLAEAGASPDAIDIVLPTHLHFDHFGGAVVRGSLGCAPRFAGARYAIRRGEWDDALRVNERSRGYYFPDHFVGLPETGVIDFLEDDREVRPGVRVVRSGGHTAHHQIVYIESEGQTAVFVGDLIPTTAHVHNAWIAAHDLYPMDTLAFKERFLREAIEREHLIFFPHDPSVSAGRVRESGGRRYVEKVI